MNARHSKRTPIRLRLRGGGVLTAPGHIPLAEVKRVRDQIEAMNAHNKCVTLPGWADIE